MWGGTLAALQDGRFAAADPDGDRLVMIEADAGGIATASHSLPRGSWPFRLVEDEAGTLWVSARGRGSVVAVDPRLGLLREVPVCREPRGLAPADGGVVVACASGELVRVRDGEVAWSVYVEDDLRDVVPDQDGWWLSRFHSAEILRVDATGAVIERSGPPTTELAPMPASTAWRMVADPDGGVIVAHQRASTEAIALDLGFGLPAYGGADCDHVVQAGLTRFTAGGVAQTLGSVQRGALPVDLAPRDDGSVWLVSAGADGLNDVAVALVSPDLLEAPQRCAFLPGLPWSGVTEGDGRAVAVAERGGVVLVQTQPFGLALAEVGSGVTQRVEAEPTGSAGFALFHRAPTGTVACASCHAEGAQDGLTWTFDQGAGPELRRTQSLAGGVVAHTAPLHWLGEHADLEALLADTLERRMGAQLAPGDSEALASWLATTPPVAGDPRPTDAIARGELAFAASGCVDCHVPPWFTDNLSHDVGTTDRGEPTAFQTPSLLGVGARGPWLHDGCATTLEERFDPACGGADHAAVDPADIPDLVAFLRSL